MKCIKFRVPREGAFLLLMSHKWVWLRYNKIIAILTFESRKKGCDAWDTNLYFSRHEYRLHNYYIRTRGG